MTALVLRDFFYRFPDAGGVALRDVSLTVTDGEFVLIAGASGSGKSTLLRALCGLVPHFHGGRFSGTAQFDGQTAASPRFASPDHIGVMLQDPDRQFVMRTVERELAFNLENLGIVQSEMTRRVAESLTYFGLDHRADGSVSALSGGERQRLALAGALIGQPDILILDEPLSQLDPSAADDMVSLLSRIHEDFGTTILICEHRLERLLPLATRVVHLDRGQIRFDGPVSVYVERSLSAFCVPRFVREMLDRTGKVTLSVREARRALDGEPAPGKTESGLQSPSRVVSGRREKSGRSGGAEQEATCAIMRLQDVAYTWETRGGQSPLRKRFFSRQVPEGSAVLAGVTSVIGPGDSIALLGPNGAGKSTLLQMMCGLKKPKSGQILLESFDRTGAEPEEFAGAVAYVPQNPGTFFLRDTLMEECILSQSLTGGSVDKDAIRDVLAMCGVEDKEGAHPFELSGGEQQRAAVAASLCANPRLLLLDEPTRGMDGEWRERFIEMIRRRSLQGLATVVVTHDTEFAAECATRVWLLVGGRLVADGAAPEILSTGMFFRPVVNRIFGKLHPAITRWEELDVTATSDGGGINP